LGDCLLWVVSSKLQKSPTFLSHSIPKLRFRINFGKKMDWVTFWANFSQTHLVALTPSSETRTCGHVDVHILRFYFVDYPVQGVRDRYYDF
jgi:hypothetical protein